MQASWQFFRAPFHQPKYLHGHFCRTACQFWLCLNLSWIRMFCRGQSWLGLIADAVCFWTPATHGWSSNWEPFSVSVSIRVRARPFPLQSLCQFRWWSADHLQVFADCVRCLSPVYYGIPLFLTKWKGLLFDNLFTLSNFALTAKLLIPYRISRFSRFLFKN